MKYSEIDSETNNKNDQMTNTASDSTADGEENKSTLVSRNITVLGRRTSVRLEPEMWNALQDIARRERCKIHDICSLINMRKKKNTSLTAAIRVFLMLYYRAASTEEGHVKAGHGNFRTMLDRARMTTEKMKTMKAASSAAKARAPRILVGGGHVSSHHHGQPIQKLPADFEPKAASSSYS